MATLRFGQQRGMNEDHVREGASGVELPSSVEWWRMAQEVKRFSNEGSELQLAHYYLKATVHNLACRARSILLEVRGCLNVSLCPILIGYTNTLSCSLTLTHALCVFVFMFPDGFPEHFTGKKKSLLFFVKI